MAQTRKKRRSKHRGTAAGTIESRGRTGRKPPARDPKLSKKEDAQARRMERLSRPPSWQRSFYRAGFAALLLFLFTRIGLGPGITFVSSLVLCLLALLIYVPLGYAVDAAVYRRFKRRGAAT